MKYTKFCFNKKKKKPHQVKGANSQLHSSLKLSERIRVDSQTLIVIQHILAVPIEWHKNLKSDVSKGCGIVILT